MKRTVVVIESQSRDKASLSLARQLLKRVACCINSRCCASLAAHCPGFDTVTWAASVLGMHGKTINNDAART